MLTGFQLTLRVRDLTVSTQFYAALPGFVIDQGFSREKTRFVVGAH